MATRRKQATHKATRAVYPRGLSERVTVLETLFAKHDATSQKLVTSVDELKAALHRYRGFWGAVTLIVSAIWAAFVLLKDNILHLFSGAK